MAKLQTNLATVQLRKVRRGVWAQSRQHCHVTHNNIATITGLFCIAQHHGNLFWPTIFGLGKKYQNNSINPGFIMKTNWLHENRQNFQGIAYFSKFFATIGCSYSTSRGWGFSTVRFPVSCIHFTLLNSEI